MISVVVKKFEASSYETTFLYRSILPLPHDVWITSVNDMGVVLTPEQEERYRKMMRYFNEMFFIDIEEENKKEQMRVRA